MIYEIKILRGAIKQLGLLSTQDYKALKSKIIRLAENPRPDGCKKLKGRPGFRIRHGNYRIIYEVHDDILVVQIIRVAHRREVYR